MEGATGTSPSGSTPLLCTSSAAADRALGRSINKRVIIRQPLENYTGDERADLGGETGFCRLCKKNLLTAYWENNRK